MPAVVLMLEHMHLTPSNLSSIAELAGWTRTDCMLAAAVALRSAGERLDSTAPSDRLTQDLQVISLICHQLSARAHELFLVALLTHAPQAQVDALQDVASGALDAAQHLMDLL